MAVVEIGITDENGKMVTAISVSEQMTFRSTIQISMDTRCNWRIYDRYISVGKYLQTSTLNVGREDECYNSNLNYLLCVYDVKALPSIYQI